MRERSAGPARNGIPWRPYRYRGADREPGPGEVVAALHARAAAGVARALAAEFGPGQPAGRRCADCGYLLAALGHAVTCGPTIDRAHP